MHLIGSAYNCQNDPAVLLLLHRCRFRKYILVYSPCRAARRTFILFFAQLADSRRSRGDKCPFMLMISGQIGSTRVTVPSPLAFTSSSLPALPPTSPFVPMAAPGPRLNSLSPRPPFAVTAHRRRSRPLHHLRLHQCRFHIRCPRHRQHRRGYERSIFHRSQSRRQCL